jgi:1-aminocyclopropane-1-carboxylate deaminase/D-cysteine desulfhydrase-like pyridoxal-dependent ACC family enzyme
MTDSGRLSDLKGLVERQPRLHLATLPTPLQELPRFSAAVCGPRIFMKRDDLTGLAFGGNKTRMFEFLLARAVAAGADSVIAGASVQSNYCRQIAAACNSLGLKTYLVLRRVRGGKDNEIEGNLLLDLLAGATVRVVQGGPAEQRRAMLELEDRLRRQGRKPFLARMAGDRDLVPDVLAYADCFRELVEQCDERGLAPTHLYLASCDTTQAGLELGRAVLQTPLQIIGVAPEVWDQGPHVSIAGCANQTAEVLGLPCRFRPQDIRNTTDFVGRGYGIPTPEAIAALKLVARTEGIFLDPVYTSKAMAALMAHVHAGELGTEDTVVFLHTGGATALFAYAEELEPDELRSHLRVDGPAVGVD